METENYIVENMIQDEEIVIKWEEQEWKGCIIEQYFPVIPCRLKAGPIISFCREKTDDSCRTQYDLYAQVLEKDNEPTIYGVGSNLYASQCDIRVKGLMAQYKK